MATLPAFYVDNVRLIKQRTLNVRGAVISDIKGPNVVGIHVENCHALRMKNNKVLRARNGIGFEIQNCEDAVLVYNVASRMTKGFVFSAIDALEVYNLTAHNCMTGVETSSDLSLYNAAFTTSKDHKTFGVATGVVANSSTVVLDYAMYHKLGTLHSGSTVTLGSNVSEKHIVYKDEENDDLTPDNITVLLNAGTENPLKTSSPDIGGIESDITDETTSDFNYFYNLLDNSFWSVENDYAAEVALIKAYQSRVFANAELATTQVQDNLYVKFAHSLLRFSELFPAHARYLSPTKYKKMIEDLWFATQNGGAVQAYQNAIGGYNLLPSFFKRINDVDDGWIIDVSYIDEDNWLLGSEGQKYGIVIDILGTSTLSTSASGECYNNLMATTADIAPVKCALHHSPQPSGYVLFSDLYNGYESSALTNMVYNDDFAVSPEVIVTPCQLITPPISTVGLAANGAASGNVEVSLLDRIYSENIARTFYVRQGESEATMGDWEQIVNHIGDYIAVTRSYVQFKVYVTGVLRVNDYEFRGICMRQYTGETLFEET